MNSETSKGAPNASEREKSSTTRLPESITEHPLFWSALAVATLGAAGVGALKTYQALRKHRESIGPDDPLFDDLVAGRVSGGSRDSRIAAVRRFAHSITQQGGRLASLHRTYKGLEPLAKYADVLQDPDALRTLAGDVQEIVDDSDMHVAQLHQALRQVDTIHNESRSAAISERRVALYNKGLRVVRPDERQWGQVDQLAREQWPFQTLRALRHGIRSPDGLIRPNSVISPEGWLAVRNYEGEVHGYASFIPVSTNFDGIDFDSFTLQQAMEGQTSAGNFNGANLLLTSTSTGRSVDLEAMEALLYGVMDYAAQVGAHKVITATYSPNIQKRQRWNAEHGVAVGSYEDWWDRTNSRGEPTDPWRRLLRLFSREQLGFNGQFMQFEVGIRELCELMSRQRRLDSIDDVQQLMAQEQVFLDAVPVPLQKIAEGRWVCTIPASFMLLYDRDRQESHGANLYSRVNLP